MSPLRTLFTKANILLAGLLLLGGGLRLYDLTDQPIDFHPTRQLRGAIVARGLYYQMLPSADPVQRQQAVAFAQSTGQYEPPILEGASALLYLLAGQELIWMARLVNTLLWLIGGLALFALAHRLVASKSQAIQAACASTALAYYLVLPFSVQASRSFQPDPGMVVWIVITAYCAYRWSETYAGSFKKESWKWAILAGASGGMAILTKAISFYTVGALMAAMVLCGYWIPSAAAKANSSVTKPYPRLFSQITYLLKRSGPIWCMGFLTLAPAALYYAGRGGRASEYFSTWTLDLLHLLLEPWFYLRWFSLVQSLTWLPFLLIALAGVLLAKGRERALLMGLWGGYLIYGLLLPYQMYTHNYYHLQLIPIIALSLVPAVERLLSLISDERDMDSWRSSKKPLLVERDPLDGKKTWRQYLPILLAIISVTILVYASWQAWITLYRQDYRGEPAYWQGIASHLPADGKIIALTQDYGYRLMYYGWRKVTLWPNRGEVKVSALRGSDKEFEVAFTKRVAGKDYFLITAFRQFEDQPDLKDYLHKHFPVLAEGSGYIIFDLKSGPPSQ